MLYLLSKRNPRALLYDTAYYPIIDDLSAKGFIDSTENLKDFKAYIYKGAQDRIIFTCESECGTWH